MSEDLFISMEFVLQPLKGKTYTDINEFYKDVTPIVAANPKVFPRNCRPQWVFTAMQQRNWIQVNRSQTPTRYTVQFTPPQAPPNLYAMNELNVVPPRNPTF